MVSLLWLQMPACPLSEFWMSSNSMWWAQVQAGARGLLLPKLLIQGLYTLLFSLEKTHRFVLGTKTGGLKKPAHLPLKGFVTSSRLWIEAAMFERWEWTQPP